MGQFKKSYAGIGELLKSPMMQKMVRGRAEKVLARAVATAPDQKPYGEGYIASFEIESGIKHVKTSRAYARVKNTSPHALYVEFGGGNTPRHRTLAKALDAAK